MLELLQYEHFRVELVNTQCTKFIDEQQLLHWQHYTRKRLELLNKQAVVAHEKQGGGEGTGSGTEGGGLVGGAGVVGASGSEAVKTEPQLAQWIKSGMNTISILTVA